MIAVTWQLNASTACISCCCTNYLMELEMRLRHRYRRSSAGA